MSGEQNCGNCDAFLRNKDMQVKPGLPHQGWCRAKPPHLMQVMMQVSSHLAPGGPQMAPAWQGVFPPTTTDVWCRKWRPTYAKNARQAQVEGELKDGANGDGTRPAA